MAGSADVDPAALMSLCDETVQVGHVLRSQGWCTSATLRQWHGVETCSGRVTMLVLRAKQLKGSIPHELCNLHALRTLCLAENQLFGHIPAELGLLIALEELLLWDNELTGAIPIELVKLTNLRRLDLSQNKLRGHIPAELGLLTALEELRLLDNELTGHIPAELGLLTVLEELILSNNELTGAIPIELGMPTNLQILELHQNKLRGPIPPELGSLIALLVLRLYHNELTGDIPPQLGGLTALQVLSLRNNQLTGPVPPELGSLTALSDLLLNNNTLSGEPPVELGYLANLGYCSLGVSGLTGAPTRPLTGAALARWQEKLRSGGSIKPSVIVLLEVLSDLWHFLVPVLDDITDVLLLYSTSRDRGGLWWACCIAFVVADAERIILLLVACLLLLCWVPFALCGTDETRGELFQPVLTILNGGRKLALHTYFIRFDGPNAVWGTRRSALRWPVMDSALWALVGSRSKSSSFMSWCGMAGRTQVGIVEETGLGLSLIHRIVHHHPYSYLARSLFWHPHGHHLPLGDMATRRSAVMLRAVGETLVVDSVFLALSVISESWDGTLSVAAASLIFSVLELVTELQHYAAEASDEMEPREDHTTRTNTTHEQSNPPAIELAERTPPV